MTEPQPKQQFVVTFTDVKKKITNKKMVEYLAYGFALDKENITCCASHSTAKGERDAVLEELEAKRANYEAHLKENTSCFDEFDRGLMIVYGILGGIFNLFVAIFNFITAKSSVAWNLIPLNFLCAIVCFAIAYKFFILRELYIQVEKERERR